MNVQVISFHCVLKNNTGQLISSTFNRDVLTGPVHDENMMLSGLARGLQNLAKGEKRSVALKAQDAYGFYNPQKVIFFPRKMLQQPVRVGEVIAITGPNGQVRSYTVLELHKDMVRLDGNHPLAGQDLIFEIETLEARSATAEEIAEVTNPLNSQLLH